MCGPQTPHARARVSLDLCVVLNPEFSHSQTKFGRIFIHSSFVQKLCSFLHPRPFFPPDDAGLTGQVREAANKIAADSEKTKEASDRINFYENETAKMRVEVDKLLEGASKDDISKARQQGGEG